MPNYFSPRNTGTLFYVVGFIFFVIGAGAAFRGHILWSASSPYTAAEELTIVWVALAVFDFVAGAIFFWLGHHLRKE